VNTKTRIASTLAASLIALLGSAAANAQVYGDTGGYNVPELQAKSTKTRAQVQAELQHARANGELRTTADGYGIVESSAPTQSAKSRDEVRAEVIQAIRSGAHLSMGDQSRG